MSDDPPEGAFASALSAALAHKQIPLSELRDQLISRGHSISLTALSYWRSGQRLPERRPSLDALPALESILDLAAGSLSKLVPGPVARRLGHVERFDRLLDYPVQDPQVDSSLLGESDISRVMTHVSVRVGPQREILWARMRRLVVANRDGVEGFTIFMATDADTGAEPIRFEALAGCTVHEDHQPAHNVRRVNLRFPRPLMLGESALTEVETTQVHEVGLDLTDDYEILAEQRLEEALIWVTFDPDAVPPRCWVYFSEAGLKHEWPVDLDGTFSVHYRQRDFGPGGLGIRWEW